MVGYIKKILEPYINELKKVEWPTWDELYFNTITVLVASLLLAAIIAFMDIIFQFLVGGLYDMIM